MNRGKIAADIHKRMVDDNRFGYSWEERYGARPEKWTVDNVSFTMNVGDYDCSSSTITAWKKALTGTKYANALNGATYTGNMRSVFVASGLFEWKPMSFLAQPGDLYLNESTHVAMCQTQTPDVLSEFCWGDKGAYGNKRGDQSGYEAYSHGYYDYPWNGILHYNGKADSPSPSPEPDPKPTPTPTPETAPDKITWRVKQNGVWKKAGFVGISNVAITGLAIDLKGHGWYQVCTAAHGWLDPVRGYDISDDENGYAGLNDSPITAVTVYYETPNPSKTGYWCAKYRVSDVGMDAYYDYQIDNEISWNMDGYAGNYHAIDRFDLKLVKC